MLEPTEGAVILGGEDVTALPQHARVRRGLARTFQINQLFPEFSPAEALAAAIAERERLGADALRGAGSREPIVAEIVELLDRFGLLPDMDRPTRTLAYGKQRLLEIALALACRPKALLLDEPAAGVPESERRDILAALAALPSEVAILLIEHDMDLVFSFAKSITVLVAGRILSRARRRRSPPTRGCARSISARTRMAELLRVEALTAGYGEAIVLEALDLALDDGRSLALLGRNGVGKTTLINALIGAVEASGRVALAGVELSRLPSHRRARAGLGWVPAGAQHLPLADGRGEPDRRRAAGRVESRARLRACSRASRSGAPTWAASFPAASSRCWRSAAR